jgi:predicted GNAT family acetyltransferase
MSSVDDIGHDRSGHRGAFFVERSGKRLAEMTYSVAGELRIIVDHTDVSDELRGTGTGAKLVAAAVQWARAEGKLVVPLCPFAKSVFDKTPEFRDVLA